MPDGIVNMKVSLGAQIVAIVAIISALVPVILTGTGGARQIIQVSALVVVSSIDSSEITGMDAALTSDGSTYDTAVRARMAPDYHYPVDILPPASLSIPEGRESLVDNALVGHDERGRMLWFSFFRPPTTQV